MFKVTKETSISSKTNFVLETSLLNTNNFGPISQRRLLKNKGFCMVSMSLSTS